MAKCKSCEKEIKNNGLMFCASCRKERAERLGISIVTARKYERHLTKRAVDAALPYPGSDYCPHGNLWGECCSVATPHH